MPGRDTAPGFLLPDVCCKDYRAPKGPVWPDEPKLRKRNNGRSGMAVQVTASVVDRTVSCIFPVFNRMRPIDTCRRAASDVFVHGPAGHDGAHHASLQSRLVERRVLAFRLELGGIEHPG